MSSRPLGLCVLFVALTACGEKAAPPPAAPASAAVRKTVHTCFVQVVAKGANSFEARASGADEKAVEEDAWTQVCAQLPEADRGDCRNADKWSVAKSGGSASAGGPVTYNTHLKLTRKTEPVRGDGTAETTKDEACKLALEDACKKAGAPGDCLAAGTHEKRGEGSSSKSGF